MDERKINPLTLKPATKSYLENLESVQKLPIWKHKDEIFNTVKNNTFTILTAGTGAGKTRVTPRFLVPLLHEMPGMMVMTEPKRISAISGANTFSKDMDVEIGREVGYKIRHEGKSGASTRVQFVTEGIFLQDISNNPKMENYSVVLLDEVHERSLNMDIILAMLKFINPQNVRVVLMSATIDTTKFSKYFYNAPVISVEGQPQTISTFYTLQPSSNRIDDAIVKAIELCESDIEGDIIVFVDGAEVAEAACRKFNELYSGGVAFCVTLYATLSQEKQTYAKDVHEPGKRKVIFSTNLAEASVTINTAVFVIDTGIHKESSFELRTRASILEITNISKASANQRRGRVGRTKPGYVYRMFTEAEFESMPNYTVPEILRSNLEDITVKLLNMFDNYKTNFPESKLNLQFIDEPKKELFRDSVNVLDKEKLVTGPINSDNIFDFELTPIGKIVARFAITHQEALALVLSYRNNCTNQIMAIIAMLSLQSPFIKPNDQNKSLIESNWKSFNTYRNKFYGDQFGLLKIFDEYRSTSPDKRNKWCFDNYISSLQMSDTVMKTYEDLRDLLEKRRIKSESKTTDDPKSIGKALLAGFFLNIAIKLGNDYVMVYSDTRARIGNSSILRITKPKYILYTSLSKARDVYYLGGCYEIDLKWLLEINPRQFEKVKEVIKKYGLKE